MLYDYILRNYKVEEPILIGDLSAYDSNTVNARKTLQRLVDAGKLVWFDTGIYYIPKKYKKPLNEEAFIDKVVEKRFIKNEDGIFGYRDDTKLKQNLAPKNDGYQNYEVVSNKATKDYREFAIRDTTIIVRKPRLTVTAENHKILQLLDIIKDMSVFDEVDNEFAWKLQKTKLEKFMKKEKITMTQIRQYIKPYPDKVFKNLFLLKFRLL